MNVIRSIETVQRDPNSVVTVGTFDGVHRAHQEIVREVVLRAKQREGRSVVVTFDPHPKQVVPSKKGPVSLLTTIDERIDLLGTLGVDLLVVLRFTYDFSRQSSREFYERYLVNGTGVAEVVVGYDHMFGRDREGTIEELVRMGQEFDFSVFALHPYSIDGEIVSSTAIRRALVQGDVEQATAFLGREYVLEGLVVRGDERGRGLGYPTANIRPSSGKKVIPARGVYLVAATVQSKSYFGMLNIGVRPTVTNAGDQTIEVHLFEYSGDLYGSSITVRFMKKLRDEQRFTSLQALTDQLGRDKEESLRLVARHLEKQKH